MERYLWRLQTSSPVPDAPAQFAAGLRLHLEYTDLLTILVRIGEVQQAYISAEGCAGCRRGRHEPGCHGELLRRLLMATFAVSEPMLVPLGLARRPYCHVIFAQPSKQSKPFTGADLAAWDEARFVMHWKRGAGGLTTAALLAVGDGPDPVIVVRERGWTARRLPNGLGLRMANTPIPTAVWFRRAWPSTPFLLTPPHDREQGTHPPVLEITP